MRTVARRDTARGDVRCPEARRSRTRSRLGEPELEAVDWLVVNEDLLPTDEVPGKGSVRAAT